MKIFRSAVIRCQHTNTPTLRSKTKTNLSSLPVWFVVYILFLVRSFSTKMKCVVPSCTTDFHKIPAGITQHRFPTDDDRQAQWLEAIRTAENCRPGDLSAVNFNRDRICSKHFHITCFYKVKGQVRLNKYATPFEEPTGLHFNGTSHIRFDKNS